MIQLSNVLTEIVKPIVANPDQINIIESNTGKDVLLQLNVAADDMGKVIGRHGKIAKAIRTVMKAAATSAGLHVRVDILDFDEFSKTDSKADDEQ